jgi:hypothetical protein
MTRRTGLDGRHRDLSGQIDRKHGNTTVKRLRLTYANTFAKGRRSDLQLVNLLVDEKVSSLRQLLIKHPRWR